MARGYIPLKVQLAAALCQIADIPYEHAKVLTPDQILSLFHLDHGIYHAWEASPGEYDKHWNMRFRFIKEHREKTKKDVGIIAKTRKTAKSHAAHKDKMAAKMGGLTTMRGEADKPTAGQKRTYGDVQMAVLESMRRDKRKSKIPSRPFAKSGRKLQSRNNLKKRAPIYGP